MPDSVMVKEGEVLVAATRFLVERGVKPFGFSFPRGKGIDTARIRKEIYAVLDDIGVKRIRVSVEGVDITGVSETELWQIECKGSGAGKVQTQRNNFDRALASVVSYCGAEIPNLPEECRTARHFLGLALPASPAYLRELKRRVHPLLRKRLNLWVLLYDAESNTISAISPEDNY